MEDNKNFLNWPGLDLYTKEIKEWVLKLIRKVHARIGHVEEDLAQVKKQAVKNYYIKESETHDKDVIYQLYDSNGPVEASDKIVISGGGVNLTKWEENLN